jgi:hypothetical protein
VDSKEQLRARLRSIAIFSLIFGPAMTVVSLGTAALVWVLRGMMAEVEMPLPPMLVVLMGFGVKSAVVMAPLGVVIGFAGWRARREMERGRAALYWAAWVAVIATLALAALWELECMAAGVPMGIHVTGTSAHLAQAVAIWFVVRFLGSAAMAAACAR